MKINFLPTLENFIAVNEILQNKELFTLNVLKNTILSRTFETYPADGVYVFDIEGKKTLSRFVLCKSGWTDFEIHNIETKKTVYFRNTKAETESHLGDIIRGCVTSLLILENTL